MVLPLDLTWDAPAGCPDDVAVVARVERILVAPAPPGVTVIAKGRVRVTDSRRFELTLTLRTGDVEETRTVEAASCSAIADASAVVIALAMDPSHAHVTPEPEIATVVPPPPPPPPPAPAPPPPPPPPKEPARGREPFLAIDVGGTTEPTTLPRIGGGLEVAALARVKRFRLGVRSAFWLRENPVFDDASGAGASFGMFQVGATAAYLVPVARTITVGPVLGVDADIVRVRGFGIRDPQTSWTSWPAVALGVRGETQLHRYLGLFARADLVVPIDPPPFILGATSASGAVPLFEVPAVGPRFTAGIEVLLP